LASQGLGAVVPDVSGLLPDTTLCADYFGSVVTDFVSSAKGQAADLYKNQEESFDSELDELVAGEYNEEADTAARAYLYQLLCSVEHIDRTNQYAELQKTGLMKVAPLAGKPGGVMWVSPESEREYKKHGSACLGDVRSSVQLA